MLYSRLSYLTIKSRCFNLGPIVLLFFCLLCFRILVVCASSSETLNEDVCAVTAIFNPLGYASRIANFHHARQWSRRQHLRLIIVELVFIDEDNSKYNDNNNNNKNDFVLVNRDDDKGNDDGLTKHIEVKTNKGNVMWQKEALLNIGIKQIPSLFPKCTKVIWLDSDVILEDGWIEQASKMLDRHHIGQIFTHVVRLPRGVMSPHSYWSEPRMQRMGFGIREGQVQYCACHTLFGGHTGFAWGARLNLLLDKKNLRFFKGLYPKAIVGGFDALLAHALLDLRCEVRLNEAMSVDFEKWTDSLLENHKNLSVGYPQVTIKAAALWHGENKDRNYQDRHQILLKHGFDPNVHVRLNEQGVLEWTSKATCELKRDVYEMFVNRREDGNAESKKVEPYFCVDDQSEEQCT